MFECLRSVDWGILRGLKSGYNGHLNYGQLRLCLVTELLPSIKIIKNNIKKLILKLYKK